MSAAEVPDALVEKAARALWASVVPDEPWGERDSEQDACRNEARVVLTAASDAGWVPSEVVVKAAEETAEAVRQEANAKFAGWVPAERLALVRDSCRDVTADLRARLLAANDRLADAEARVRREVAEALRAAATDADRVADDCEVAYRNSYSPYDQGVADAWQAAADGLRERAAALAPTTDKGATR